VADRTIIVELRALTDRYRTQMQQAGQVTGQTGQQMGVMQRQGSALMGTVRRLVPALGAAGLARAMRQSFNAAADFESSAARLQSQIGLTAQEANGLADAARNVGTQTGIGAQEAVDASFFIASAGLRGQAAMDALEASAQAARVGLGDTATVADLVTSAMNAYGPATLDASQATDVLIGAVREGKAEASELAGSMGQVLPIASEMGVTFDQVGAAMAAMTRTGTNAATASTQLRAIMVSLLNPSQGAAEAMADLGLSAAGLRQTIREDGLFEALMQVRAAVGDNEEAMSQIFPNVRALAGVLDLTGANAADTAAIFENMADTTGLLSDAIEIVEATTADKLARLRANFEETRISIGESMMESTRAIDGLNQAFETGAFEFAFGFSGAGVLAGMDGPGGIFRALLSGDHARVAREINQALHGTATATEDVDRAMQGLNVTGERYQGLADRAANSTAELGDEMDGTADATDGLTQSLQEQADQLRAQVDPMFRLNKAIENLDELQQDSEASALDLADAALEVMSAAGEAAGMFDGQLDPAFRAVLEAAGLTEDQIREVEDAFTSARNEGERFSRDYRASIEVTGLERTLSQMRALNQVRRDITSSGSGTTVRIDEWGNLRAHTGGLVVPGGIQRFHSGGLASDEVPAILQTGELVLSRNQVGMLSAAFSNLPAFHDGGYVNSGTANSTPAFTVNQTFASGVDRSTLVEARHQQKIAYQMAYG
jgi:TP901 family phage tail tape measure protein